MKPKIWLAGDTHGEIDRKKIEKFAHKHTDEKDFLIILGDFGGIWYNDERDQTNLTFYKENVKPTVLFLDGNHENHKAISRYPITRKFGGNVQKIQDNLYHLMRGEIYEIAGKKLFVMGGADSIDKYMRKPGVSWWPEEMPSETEYKTAEDNLEKAAWTVDYILTHCCSSKIQYRINPGFTRDNLTDWFNDMEYRIDFDKWYFGHYHMDEMIDKKHICLYQTIIELGKNIEEN